VTHSQLAEAWGRQECWRNNWLITQSTGLS
jgi:hypothetical protein